MKESFYNYYMPFSKQLREQIKDNTINVKNKLLLESNCLIVPENVNEQLSVQNLFFKRKYSSRLYHLTINTSLDCNLKCWYCYETHNSKTYMSLDIVQKILKHLDLKFKSMPFEILELMFFGGEPMLNYRVVSSILLGVKRLQDKYNFKLRTIFVTNGTLITQSYIELLRNFTVRFQITIDGDKKTHNKIRTFKSCREDSYSFIIKGLRELNVVNADFFFVLRINYDGYVLDNIESLIDDLSFLNRDKCIISLHKVWQCNQNEININKVFQTVEKFNKKGFRVDLYSLNTTFDACYADNMNQAVINYDGMVFKCTARDFLKSKAYGKLNEYGIIEWNIDMIKKRLSLDIPSMCQSCKLLPSCPGVCSQCLLENKSEKLKCPFDGILSKQDIVLLNMKQQLITKHYAKRVS